MIGIASVGIITILLAVLSKGIKNEYGVYISICGSILLLCISVSRFSGIVEIVERISSYVSVNDSYIIILVKMLGIAFVSEFTSGICKDAGFSSVASLVDIIGKLSILLTGAPILEALLSTVFSSGYIR